MLKGAEEEARLHMEQLKQCGRPPIPIVSSPYIEQKWDGFLVKHKILELDKAVTNVIDNGTTVYAHAL
jgi:hypothetical protein